MGKTVQPQCAHAEMPSLATAPSPGQISHPAFNIYRRSCAKQSNWSSLSLAHKYYRTTTPFDYITLVYGAFVSSHQSSAARKALRDTIVACNSLAMSALGRGNTERCRDLLARAFEIASDRQMRGGGIGDKTHKEDNAADNGGGGDPVLQILTLNNTACLHRR